MANFCKTEDTSDDDFSDNLKLTERLRLNRDQKVMNFQRKNGMDEKSSSSSSLEIHNDLHRPGPSRAYGPYNKKRQNGDKTVDLLANPKRTCLSNRFPRSDLQNKKKSQPMHAQVTDFPNFSTDPSRPNIFADKTYEDHIHNLSDSRNAVFNSSKHYSKNTFNGLDDRSKSPIESLNGMESMNCASAKISESRDPQDNFTRMSSTYKELSKQYMYPPDLRISQNDSGEHSKSVKNRTGKPVSYIAPHIPEFYQRTSPPISGNSVVHYIDSASDEDSRSMIKSGALKGGRQSPELSLSHKKVIGRKVKKKVLDSDNDTEDDDWLTSVNRTRPRLIFSSSDSETETPSRKGSNKVSTNWKSDEDWRGIVPIMESVSPSNEIKRSVPSEYPENCTSFPGPSSSVYHSKSPVRSYRNRKYSRSNAAVDLSPNSYQYNRSSGNGIRGRSRVNVGERYARRSGSPHPRTLPNSLPRMTRPDPKSSKGRSLTGTRSQRANMNLATTYPDIFDAEDSSEVEFFTANSYSDTETSAESFGGLRISTTVMNPENSGVICEHSINVGSSEDEISVVFSTGPRNGESRIESQVVRNGEQRRGSRTMGRRRQRGSMRQFHDNIQEVISLSPDPVEQVRQVEDDERFAIMLQAQFDAEVDPTYVPPVASSPPLIFSSYGGLTATSTDDTDTDINEAIEQYIPRNTLPFPLINNLNPLSSEYQRSHRANQVPPGFGSIAYNNRRIPRTRRRRRQQLDTRGIIRALRDNISIGLMSSEIFPSDDSYETFLGLAELNGDVPHGLSKSEINRLPTRKFMHSNSESSAELLHKRAGLNKECQVCLSDYENGDTLRILPCFHEFHTPCIDPWLKTNNTCPVCRVVVEIED